MRKIFLNRKLLFISSLSMIAIFALLAMPAATFARAVTSSQGAYKQVNLVSNVASEAPVTDPNLVNPWGLVAGPATPWWVSDNDTGLSTLYNGQGNIVPLVVTVPTPLASPATQASSPTGVVFNGTTGFVVSQNGVSGAGLFIFDTEDGTISAWNPNVNRTNAILTVDRSKVGKGAVYKGLAIDANSQGNTFLFAANFRFGDVEVFDSNFKLVSAFTDPILSHTCINKNQCFAPFGIQAIGNQLVVTFALQDAQKANDVAGRGLGFADIFTTDGKLVRRIVSLGTLNAPWGVALAPANFGKFSNDLLIGNFGDGHIHAFDPKNGLFVGEVKTDNGKPLVIPGLWALEFGNGAAAGPTNQLYFTDGPDNHGLFGFIESES